MCSRDKKYKARKMNINTNQQEKRMEHLSSFGLYGKASTAVAGSPTSRNLDACFQVNSFLSTWPHTII